MSYYLSDSNERYLQPFLSILRNSKGEVSLDTHTPRVLINILRSAANTRYPELKGWRYKLKETKVRAIPTNPYNETVIIITESIDYIGIVNTIISTKPISILFSGYQLDDDERVNMAEFCNKLEYQLEYSNEGLKIFK